MKMYKLTTQEATTHGDMKWAIGKKNTAKVKGTQMCSPDLLHCYAHPVLALLLNPIHANIVNPRLFEVECSEILADDKLKYGCKTQLPTQELIPMALSIEHRVEFAIRVAMASGYSEPRFLQWCKNWLSGVDRSARAAARAAEAAPNSLLIALNQCSFMKEYTLTV